MIGRRGHPTLAFSARVLLLLLLDPHRPCRGFRVLWNHQYPGGPGAAGPRLPSNCSGGNGAGPPLDLSRFNITTNAGQALDGDEVTIFYQDGIGLYPQFARGANGSLVPLHGGVPQQANLTAHTAAVMRQVDGALSPDFAGIGVIDYEGWHPSWEYMTDPSHAPFVTLSKELVSREHPTWAPAQVEKEARRQWESAARLFMTATLDAAHAARPRGRFGFFSYPTCYDALYDWNPRQVQSCSPRNVRINDELGWLFSASGVLLPGAYLVSANEDFSRRQVQGCVGEAMRVAKAKPVYVYGWDTYYRPGIIGTLPGNPPCAPPGPGHSGWTNPCHLSAANVRSVVEVSAAAGADGLIWWGSIGDLKDETGAMSAELCADLSTFITGTLGPVVRKQVLETADCAAQRCHSHGRCVDAGQSCRCDEGWAGASCAVRQRWEDPPHPPGINVFRAGDGGFAMFRTPILATVEGPVPALVVAAEARKFSFQDYGTHGIVVRTSYDSGRTWTPATQVVTDPIARNLTMELACHGNVGILTASALVHDRVAGRLLLMFPPCSQNCSLDESSTDLPGWSAWQASCLRPTTGPYACPADRSGRGFVVAADTSQFPFVWGTPYEITHQLPSEFAYWTAGPNGGVQLPSGRLVVCGSWQSSAKNVTTGSALLLSDTHGQEWRIGAIITTCRLVPPHLCTGVVTDECQPALMTNGSLLVTLRAETSPKAESFRWQARSDDQGETVSDLRRTNIPDNGNTGSILISGDGELLVSNAYSHTSRSNLTISHSADGAEWSPRVLVNPGASGYSSMANIPQAMRPGGQSVGIAFERNGGFCPKDSYIGKMSCCENASGVDPQTGKPCSGWGVSSVSFAAVDVSPNATHKPHRPPAPPPGGSPSTPVGANTSLLSLAVACCLKGWEVCNSSHAPAADSQGAWGQFDAIFARAPPSNGSVDFAAPLSTKLASGKELGTLDELLRYDSRWQVAQAASLGDAAADAGWERIVRDAADFALQQTAGVPIRHTKAGLMEAYAEHICTQLSSLNRTAWWMWEAVYSVDKMLDASVGLGTAQLLSHVKHKCPQVQMVWSVGSAAVGKAGYMSRPWETWLSDGQDRAVAMVASVVETVDYIMVSAPGQADQTEGGGTSFFSFSDAISSGECFINSGMDHVVQELTQWSANPIPQEKLLLSSTPVSTAFVGCQASLGPNDLVPCMPSVGCRRQRFLPGDMGGNPQRNLLEAVTEGTVDSHYDKWAQQSWFSGNLVHDGEVVSYVDTSSAQEFEFRLRHAQWRGAGGVVSVCAETDFSSADDMHWTQPAHVLHHVRDSHTFVAALPRGIPMTPNVSTGNPEGFSEVYAATASFVTPADSGDGICRLLGGRLGSVADLRRAASTGARWSSFAVASDVAAGNVFKSVLARPVGTDGVETAPYGPGPAPSAAVCRAPLPAGPTGAWPLTVGGETSTTPSFGKEAEAYQVSFSPGVHNKTAPGQRNGSLLDPAFLREVLITPMMALVLAEAFNGSLATQDDVLSAAAAGAEWCKPGLTLFSRWPVFNAFIGEQAGAFPFQPGGSCVLRPGVADGVLKAGSGRLSKQGKEMFDTVGCLLDGMMRAEASGLSAVNIRGRKPSEEFAAEINGDAQNPLHIHPFAPGRWSQFS